MKLVATFAIIRYLDELPFPWRSKVPPRYPKRFMSSHAGHDLSHICFEGQAPTRPERCCTPSACHAAVAVAPEDDLDEFLAWVLGRAGLDAAAYRSPPLHRRLPACLRTLKVHSTHAARELLERKPHLLDRVVSSLLIGVTEFFREPAVFDSLSTQILPALASHNRPLRIWSAACSNGAELYSMAILLAEAGLLEGSFLLGTDCRGDAIEQARWGRYEASALRPIPPAMRDTYFEPAGRYWRPVEFLRRAVHWKAADLLTAVERGPWDILLWRNAAIYLKPGRAESVWRRLASALAAEGALITGKAERPPHDAGLQRAERCVYRMASRREVALTYPRASLHEPCNSLERDS